MEQIMDSRNWIGDSRNCTVGKYVCTIVDSNLWSPLWLSVIKLWINMDPVMVIRDKIMDKYEHP